MREGTRIVQANIARTIEHRGVPERLAVRIASQLVLKFQVRDLGGEPGVLDRLPDFKLRLEWFIGNRPDLASSVACMRSHGHRERRLLSIVDKDQLRCILRAMLDEKEME